MSQPQTIKEEEEEEGVHTTNIQTGTRKNLHSHSFNSEILDEMTESTRSSDTHRGHTDTRRREAGLYTQSSYPA